MVTADEIKTITIFTSLTGEERERLARAAADITLAGGQYAAQEGDERALFAVLSGQIEVVKLVDGVEQVIGNRHPGDVFGEVPITLGAPFPAAFRAIEPSRILRLDPEDFHAVSASAPAVAKAVGRLARKRIGGLQGLAADPPPPRAIVIGQRLDPRSNELRHFLERNQISFRWVALDAEDAAAEWGGPLPAPDDCPVIRVVDGKTVVRPHHSRVAELLGLDTDPREAEYDTIVVGAGPAGLAAAVYGASEGLRTLVIEREAPGGQAGTSSRIENYLGFPSGVSGDELASRALQQARRLGAEILVTREITRIDAPRRQVHLDGGDVLTARTIILACGVSWRRLPVEGFDRLAGKGIYYGASPGEAPGTHGLDVHVVGGGNSAGQAALNFSNHARSVTILCRSDALEQSMSQYLVDHVQARSNIGVHLCREIVAAHGDTSLETIDIRNNETGEIERVESGGVYIFIGADAETQWLPPEILLDKNGYVLTGTDVSRDRWPLERDPYLLETSVPGIFACGDVRLSPVKRVAAAVGEGSMAIAFVHQHLRDSGIDKPLRQEAAPRP